MKEVKILGEDRCHIQLIEAILRKRKIRGINPKKFKLKGAGSVSEKFREQLRSEIYFDGEIILLDADRREIEIPEIQKLKRDCQWDVYLMVIEPNCEGLILKWMGEEFSNPKNRFKELSIDHGISDYSAFVNYAVDNLVNWGSLPDSVYEFLNFLKKIKNLKL